MGSRTKEARIAGLVYLLFALLAVASEFLFPAFLVPGDPAATAQRIAAAEGTYRLGILAGFATLVLFILLVSRLYGLLAEVDAQSARLMALLVTVGVAVGLANLLARFAPLVLLGNADALAAFARPQLDAMAFAALRWRGAGSNVAVGFWGLWLFPFGLLVIRSRFLPKALGYLLLAAGVGYLATSATAIALPDHRALVSKLMTPLYAGELPIIFWLLLAGAREREAAAPPPAS